MFACKIPANINRKSFAFDKWKDWEPNLFELIRESQLKKVINPNIQIKGSDKAPSAVEKAKQNIENANLSEFIQIEKKDFFQLEKETKGPLHLLTNPPYGERLEGDMNALYQGIGDGFKQSFPFNYIRGHKKSPQAKEVIIYFFFDLKGIIYVKV